MSLNICYFGNSVLRQKGRKIEKFDEQLTNLATDMLEIMHTSEGIGLAAQQIGKAIQFCVMEVPDYPDYPTA